MNKIKCRFCGEELKHTFVDLGVSPLANNYIDKENLHRGEVFYPLHVMVCEKCFLVQALEYEEPKNIFTEYKYFSSCSQSWLGHMKTYVENVVERFQIDKKSNVMEIASNDGYLLQFFKEKSIPILGIEPAANVARVAEGKGIPTLVEFFGRETALKLKEEGRQADLLIGNNVLAHVPYINDFVAGIKILLKDTGIVTMEFPHVLNLIEKNQFDTIYHEHFSYLSLLAVRTIFKAHELKLFDVEELPTHGGSLRIYATHEENDVEVLPSVMNLLNKEVDYGLADLKVYTKFNETVRKIKRDILEFMIKIKKEGKSIVAYGAPAKGNTLLNYCGIGKDFIDYTVDISPHKQGMYLPGTHIPIYSVEEIRKTEPDYVIILPWNIKEEIIDCIKKVSNKKVNMMTLIPDIYIINF